MASEHRGKASRVTQFQSIEEDVTYPLCCDRCLGPSNLLRMTKEIGGKRCGVCQKPFTNFKWHNGGKSKATMICRSCSASRGNKCQSCLGQLTKSEEEKGGAKKKEEESSDVNNNKLSGARRERDDSGAESSLDKHRGTTNQNSSSKAVRTQENKRKPSSQQQSSGFGFDWMGNIS